LIVSLDLGNGEAPIEFVAGESVAITLPEDGPISLTPSFRLENTFTNITDIAGDASLTIEALESSINFEIPNVDIAVPELFEPFLGDSISIPIPDVSVNGGPLLSDTTNAPWAAPAFAQSWELEGFQTFTGEAIISIPEPSSIVLAGIGTLALLAVSRRRHGSFRRRASKTGVRGIAHRSNKRRSARSKAKQFVLASNE